MEILFILILKLTDCDECDEYTKGPECAKHIFRSVADTVPKTRCGARYAVKTLPATLHVKISSIPCAGKGVFAKKDLPVNTRFGPYTGVKIDFEDIDAMDTSYMWEVMVLICYLVGLKSNLHVR